MTDIKVINRDYKSLKEKLSTRMLKKYFEQVNILLCANKNTITEYRQNGVVTEENGKLLFHAIGDMDLKKWRIAWVSEIK